MKNKSYDRLKKREEEPAVNYIPPTWEEAEKYNQNLKETPKVMDYLVKQRGLSEKIINWHMLGWDGQRITIPICDIGNNLLFFKLAKGPDDNNPDSPKMRYRPAGARAELFDWCRLKYPVKLKLLVVCEGELDRLVLERNGFPAVTGTSGAKTFKSEWAEKIAEVKNVYVCYDNDKAGKQGAENTAIMIRTAGGNPKVVILPEEVGESGDVTDFFVRLKKTRSDFQSLLNSAVSIEEYCGQVKINLEDKPIILDNPETDTNFGQWQKVVEENFMELTLQSEILMSCVGQLLIKDITNPFGIVCVDVPSSGKTIVLNFFSEVKELVFTLDNFTPSSFVSHASNRKAKDLEKIDLLPQIKNKILIVRDLAPMFGQRDDDLLKSMGLLTRVFDGEGIETASGVHGKRGYIGKYMFIFLAASTPIRMKLWKLMGNLGSRLYFLNFGSREKSEDELATQLLNEAYKEKEHRCRAATADFIRTLWGLYPDGIDWQKENDAKSTVAKISRLAKLLARLRGTVSVWESKENIQHDPTIIERPDRINQGLYNLARGHALIKGRLQIAEEDLDIVKKVALDSAPFDRAQLFKTLIAKFNGRMNSLEVENELACSRPTALKQMEALRALGLVNDTKEELSWLGESGCKEMTIKDEFKWLIDEL